MGQALINLPFQPLILKMDKADRKSEESNLLVAIILSLASANDFNTAFHLTLKKISQVTGWIFGEVWVPRKGENCLENSGIYYAAQPRLVCFKQASEHFTFNKGRGMPGKAWDSAKPQWIRDVSRDSQFIRKDLAAEFGIKAGVAIPIFCGTDILAVMQFFLYDANEKDDRWLEILFAIGLQLGAFIQKIRAEEALRKSYENLEVKIEERTRELLQVNQGLKNEIAEREKIELQLKEKNLALREILNHIEMEKKSLGDQVMANIRHFVWPFVQKMRGNALPEAQKYLDLLEKSFNEILSPFGAKVENQHPDLTPRELEIANMVRSGMTIKGIASVLKISPRTIETHRMNMRKKLGLSEKGGNLATHLSKL